VTNLTDLAGTLASTLHVTASAVITAVEQAKPTDFVPVITLRQPAYLAVQARIHDLPGTVFRTGTQLVGPSPHFAQPLLGQVGNPTVEALRQAGPGYLATDTIGLSGLQQVYNRQLAGTASVTIEVRDHQGHTVAQLGQFAGHPGSPLQTTLDTRVQRAADSALSKIGLPAAIVAVRPSTGANSFSLLSEKLPADALSTAAAEYGFGAGWQLPVDSFSGSFTAAKDPVEQAANAFGQGTDLVSPLSQALMTATVAHGSTPAPMLIEGQPATAKNLPTNPPATALAALPDFMRAVVTRGTATDLAGVPGGALYGKTGTAEHGTTQPPQADSWFTGYQGDLAFTMLVVNGQTSGVLANPVARVRAQRREPRSDSSARRMGNQSP
jgi:cell division protein FtsI/penicillin-binding protein 2